MPHTRAPSPYIPPSMSESGCLVREVGGFSLLSKVRALMSLESKRIDTA